MDRISELVERNFSSRNGELCTEDIPIHVLADSYGTPFYVYDSAVAKRRLSELRWALPRNFSVCYSVKANPNRLFMSLFLGEGCGLEVASGGEFLHALCAGCSPDRILFAGPGKTNTELQYVLSNQVGEIHAESIREIERISDVAKQLNKKAAVALRINPQSAAEGGAMRMGGKPAPFGIDEELLEIAVSRILSEDAIEFRGIHMFTGTQILDADVLTRQYEHGLRVARRAAELSGRPLHRVDFGGGLGVPYFGHENRLDLEKLKGNLAALFRSVDEDKWFHGTEFLVEPGRFLVAESGIYVARITEIKLSRGKKFLITDGGMHQNLAASGNLGQTIKRNYPVAILNKLDCPVVETADIVGPLCTPLDVLARNVEIPEAEEGDLIGVFQSGAYGRSASPLSFLSHPAPPEVWVEGGNHSLARRRGDADDVCDNNPSHNSEVGF